jgi:hypothetical protein
VRYDGVRAAAGYRRLLGGLRPATVRYRARGSVPGCPPPAARVPITPADQEEPRLRLKCTSRYACDDSFMTEDNDASQPSDEDPDDETDDETGGEESRRKAHARPGLPSGWIAQSIGKHYGSNFCQPTGCDT